MDIFSALQSAVSGLKAQSFALDNISGPCVVLVSCDEAATEPLVW
jgi:hypothetical protein